MQINKVAICPKDLFTSTSAPFTHKNYGKTPE